MIGLASVQNKFKFKSIKTNCFVSKCFFVKMIKNAAADRQVKKQTKKKNTGGERVK